MKIRNSRIRGKRLTAWLLAALLLVSALPFAALAGEAPTQATSSQEEAPLGYFENQLTTKTARALYQALGSMLADGSLQTGKASLDLVQAGILENRTYAEKSLSADFYAARDAFCMDHPELFYVDFSKLSLRCLSDGEKNYSITLGIGREDSYFYDGFDESRVGEAVSAFTNAVKEIAALANAEGTCAARVEAAYRLVMARVSYALEADAAAENAPYVRTSYGALVRGEAACEGYARALAAVLNEMGIPNLPVMGVYHHDGLDRPHMWNYVQMDDYRYYLLDATIDDALAGNGESRAYFLLSAQDGNAMSYQEEEWISLSPLSIHFVYPALSPNAYRVADDAFSMETEGGTTYASYRGMGIGEAKKQGKYIIFADLSLLNEGKDNWYYADLYYAAMQKSVGATNAALSDIDATTRFSVVFGERCVFAVTERAPLLSFSDVTDFASAAFSGEDADILEVSRVAGLPDAYVRRAPYVVKKAPHSSRLSRDSVYDVTAVFSEELMPKNPAEPITATVTVSVPGSNEPRIEKLLIDDNAKYVRFTLHTAKTVGYRSEYVITLHNVVGVKSRMEPETVGFTVVNDPVFLCPYVIDSYNTVYGDVPAIIADRDLSASDFRDPDGNPLSLAFSSRFSLVASQIRGEDELRLLEAIEGAADIRTYGAATFDISLSLCQKEIAYCDKKPMKLLFPFPYGYTAEDPISFRAYHFQKDGTPEEVECVVTDAGIVLFCESFSTYSVVALREDRDTGRELFVHALGGGTVEKELLSLSSGESVTIRFTPHEGYTADMVTLNGKSFVAQNGEVTLQYDDLYDRGNVLEVSFISRSVAEREAGRGFFPVAPEDMVEPIYHPSFAIVVLFMVIAAAGATGAFLFLYLRKKREAPVEE